MFPLLVLITVVMYLTIKIYTIPVIILAAIFVFYRDRQEDLMYIKLRNRLNSLKLIVF